MRMGWRTWGLAVLLAGGLAGSGGAWAGPATAHAHLALGLIVKLKDQTVADQAASSVVRLQASRRMAEPTAVQQQRMAAALKRQALQFKVDRPTAFAARLLHNAGLSTVAVAEAQAQRLRQDPDVAWVVVNELLQPAQATLTAPAVVADDPDFPGQVWLQARDATAGRGGVGNVEPAWNALAGRALTPVVVAVLDSGILTPPDLADRVLPGYDFVSEVEFSRDGDGWDADPTDPGDWLTSAEKQAQPALYQGCEVEDSNWHGLSVASVLAANTGNGRDGAGVLASLPGMVLLPVRVAGTCGASTLDVIEGMLWAAGVDYAGSPPHNPYPARVINLSFGGDGSCTDTQVGSVDWLFQQTIANLASQGVLLVASAGNGDATGQGQTSPTRPASCAGVLAVTGLNQAGFKASYANLVDGTARAAVAVASGDVQTVSGVSTLTDAGVLAMTNVGTQGPDLTNAGYRMVPTLVGTSFAAPMAAGVAALMLAVDPSLSVQELLTGLTTQVAPFPTQFSGVSTTCDASYRGNCICTTQTCGSGVLDALAAVQWAMAQADAHPGAAAFPASGQPATFLGEVTPSTSADTPSSDGGGGGGGALDVGAVGLLAIAAALNGVSKGGWARQGRQAAKPLP